MAVIDPVALNHLPRVMARAIKILRALSIDADVVAANQIEAEEASNQLAEYAILVESVTQDG